MPTHARSILDHLRRLASPAAADPVLLGRWLEQRDEAAFAGLVSRHGPMVLGVCRRVLGDEHTAEDVFQATFLVLARKASALRRPESLPSFLFGVALRLARKTRGALCRRLVRPSTDAPEPADLHPDPLDTLTGRELLALVDEEVARLPEMYRLPLLLCVMQQRSVEEAAQLLGWSIGSLRGRLTRGREKLRERLTRRGLTVSVGVLALLAPAAVPDHLRAETIRNLAAPAAPAVSALAAAPALKLKAACFALFGLIATGLGASLPLLRAPESEMPAAASWSAPPAQAKDEPRRDRYGDPLPPGALGRFGTVRFRHFGWLEHLAFSPDGARLAYAGNDGIRLWETASGRPVGHFGDRADALAFLDGGRRILAGGESLIVWDAVRGKEIKRLPVKGGLHHFRMSPDGKLLAGVRSEPNLDVLLLLEAATGAVLKQLDGHEDQVNKRSKQVPRGWVQIQSVAFSPDGKTLASVCFQDKRVLVWDTATGKVRHTLPGHDEPKVVRFSPDGRLVAVGGEDRKIHLWDAATGRELQQLPGHVGAIYGLAFSPDSRKLASGVSGTPNKAGDLTRKADEPTEDDTIRLWDLKSGKCRPLHGPQGTVRDLTFSPDGKLLAAGGGGTSIYVIDIATGKRQQQHIGHEGRIFRVALSPDGSTLASGGEDNRIHLWDVKTSREKAVLEGHQHHISGLAFTPHGGELLSCSYDGTVRVWDWRRGEETRRFAETNGWHYGFDLAPDGKTVLLPTGQLWNVATGKHSGTVPNYEGLQYRLIFSPDGKRVAGPGGKAARILDVETGKEICRFTGHEPMKDDRRGGNGIEVVCVAFGPDGRRAASGGAEGMAFVWDAATGKMLRRLQGHENPIIGIAFSPDGRMVATASGSMWNHKEQTVRLWEVATGKERRRFVGHQAQVTSIVFSRDGSTIVSGSEDGTGLVWHAVGVLKPEMARVADRELLWRTLASEDAVAAFEAVCALAARKEVALLSKRLKRVEVADAAKIGRHLADLDSNEFVTRERAESELGQLEELAEPALRKALAESVSPEVRRRVEKLLTKLDANPPSAKTLQALRAIEALEHIATPEARQLLQKFADGAPEARLTREAKASLRRLALR